MSAAAYTGPYVPEDADAFPLVVEEAPRAAPQPTEMRLVAQLLETLTVNKRRIDELEHKAAVVELEHAATLHELEHRLDVATARAAEAEAAGRRRIAELEHKVHLLTEAATMFLEMKAEAERNRITLLVECPKSIVGGGGYPGVIPGRGIAMSNVKQSALVPDLGLPAYASNIEEFHAALEGAREHVHQTDTLLAALHSA